MSGKASQLADHLVAEANYQHRHALESLAPETRWEHSVRRDIPEKKAEKIQSEGTGGRLLRR